MDYHDSESDREQWQHQSYVYGETLSEAQLTHKKPLEFVQVFAIFSLIMRVNIAPSCLGCLCNIH